MRLEQEVLESCVEVTHTYGKKPKKLWFICLKTAVTSKRNNFRFKTHLPMFSELTSYHRKRAMLCQMIERTCFWNQNSPKYCPTWTHFLEYLQIYTLWQCLLSQAKNKILKQPPGIILELFDSTCLALQQPRNVLYMYKSKSTQFLSYNLALNVHQYVYVLSQEEIRKVVFCNPLLFAVCDRQCHFVRPKNLLRYKMWLLDCLHKFLVDIPTLKAHILF